jgi:hypothetical protein
MHLNVNDRAAAPVLGLHCDFPQRVHELISGDWGMKLDANIELLAGDDWLKDVCYQLTASFEISSA